MHKKFILFGHGSFGHAMLELLGEKNISFFVHNGEKERLVSGEMTFQVLPFEEYIKICQDQFTIISVSEKTEGEIVRQLLEYNMDRFLLWEDVIGIWKSDAKRRADQIRERIGIPPWLESTKQKIKSLVEEHNPLIQDKCSEVEFYMIDSFELSHFLPVYQALLKQGIKARIVAEPQAINASVGWFDYSKTVELLKEAGVDYCTLCNPYAKVAITTQFSYMLKYYSGYKIQMHYGTVWHKKRSFGYKEEVVEGFDCILVHGEFSTAMIRKVSSKVRVVDISYPRYQKIFDCPLQKNAILKELAIDTDKPILLYYPTWDEYSSIQQYWDTIRALRENFFVITKPHHCTWRLAEKRHDLALLYECSNLVLSGTYDLAKTALIADCTICDASSGIVSEIVFLNRKIKQILLLQNTDETEFYVDINQFATCVKKPEYLRNAVREIMLDDKKIQYRQSLVDHLYSPCIYTGIQRALNAIREGILSGDNTVSR